MLLFAFVMALIGSPMSFRHKRNEEEERPMPTESHKLLQILWLFGESNDVQGQVAEVDVPSVLDLRRLAMMDARMDMLRRRSGGKGTDE